MRRSPLITTFLDYLKIEEGLSQNTVRSYALDLTRLQEWTIANGKVLRGLTERDIQLWMGTRFRANLSASSVARALSTIRSFFNFLVLDGHIQADPTVNLAGPPKTRPLPSVLTIDQVKHLLSIPDTTTDDGLRNRAFLELLYATGLRVTEAISLTHLDLNAPARLVRCLGKGNKERLVPITAEALEWIQHLIATYRRPPRPTARIFLHQRIPFTRQFAWTLVSNYAAKARLKNVTPHSLRHSFATHMLENGAQTIHVQALLGHAHLSTTEIYLAVTKTHARKSYDKHHPRAHAINN